MTLRDSEFDGPGIREAQTTPIRRLTSRARCRLRPWLLCLRSGRRCRLQHLSRSLTDAFPRTYLFVNLGEN
jgi:hypothetical protein